ncbi:CPBP family intramembrane metalloprotease [Dokdonia sinensis]|uniref:CPBP family intramembrane metalloprotease n=1 Tax=Dokdonia sinensis TaxID=2479847 RepID=A0A3M0GDA2_9FLAO|nr:CPBP family intramembrane glutamic endopeptidase [Dokdonia sinensis]RMB59553.1 CPBP family intramembrane metalloprotease [Dokdonia sinensis]
MTSQKPLSSTRNYLIAEFFVLFVATPLSLLLPYDFRIKVATILIAFSYLLFVLFRKTAISFTIKKDINWKWFFWMILSKFLVIAVVTGIYVYVVDATKLFCVPRTDLKLFGIILLVYTFLSVWPQEAIYRTFFFERYGQFFNNRNVLIFVNAVIFSLAHIFLQNVLVTVLTFIGGLLFAYTYEKSRSTTLVSIEHAVYGNWLFTVGLGEMLAFPGMGAC